jgi:hypothetical protein
MRYEVSDHDAVVSPFDSWLGMLLGTVPFRNPTLRRWHDPGRMVTVFEWENGGTEQ